MLKAKSDTAWDSFTGIADLYDCRPPYPADCVHALNTRLGSELQGHVVEIGAGTGIFTRTLATELVPHASILAIEPNADMRDRARRVTPGALSIQYEDGIAEKLDLPNGSVKALVAAAAAQRFDRPAFYRETARVLMPGGWLMLVHNNPRDADSEFFSEYLGLTERYAPQYKRGQRTASNGSYQEVDFARELASRPEFAVVESQSWRLDEYVDWSKLEQLVLSSTILAPALKALGAERLLSEARELFTRHQNHQGLVFMPYITEAVFAGKSL